MLVGRAPGAAGTVRAMPTIRMTAAEMRDAAMACRAYAFAREKEAVDGGSPAQREILLATQRRHEDLAERFDQAAAISATRELATGHPDLRGNRRR